MSTEKQYAPINPYIMKTDDGNVITDEGRRFLSDIVTNVDGKVYAFKEKAPGLIVAGAMARLSRSPLDLREIYLNEFVVDPDQINRLLQRVVTEYGDDSVQQLMTMKLVVEDASNLLTKMLERGRLLAYLERSTRYVFYDTKRNGKFRYYTAPNLSGDLRGKYIDFMDRTFNAYSQAVRTLTDYFRTKHPEPAEAKDRQPWLNATRAQACDAARALLPAATQSTVGIVGSAQGFDNMIMKMMSEELEEFRDTAASILEEVRKVAAPFFERTDIPTRGSMISAYRHGTTANIRDYLETLAGGKLARFVFPDPKKDQVNRTEVNLLGFNPSDEFEIVGSILFSESMQSMATIEKVVLTLSDEEKRNIILRYIGTRTNRRQRPGRAFEGIHYKWEILADYGAFRDLQRHRMVDEFEWEDLHPFGGYSQSADVAHAGLEKLFTERFNDSQEMYEIMVASGAKTEAQYVTLFGHNVRFRFTENAREAYHIHELRTSSQAHPCYKQIVREMHRQISIIHPTIAEGMKFVGTEGDDPALTRLISEKLIQSKLAKLDAV